MSTSRSPHDPTCILDLGAQYISATPEYAELHSRYRLYCIAANCYFFFKGYCINSMFIILYGTSRVVSVKNSVLPFPAIL